MDSKGCGTGNKRKAEEEEKETPPKKTIPLSEEEAITEWKDIHTLFEEVWARLGRRELCAGLLVSSEWYNRITDKTFLNKVMANSKTYVVYLQTANRLIIRFEGGKEFLEHGSLGEQMRLESLIGSARNLICAAVEDKWTILIINPKTHSCKKITEDHSGDLEDVLHPFGFGYSVAKKEHQVVRLHTRISEEGEQATYANIFSVEGANWRRREFPGFAINAVLTRTIGCYNGKVFWFAANTARFVTFDLQTEALGIVELPERLFRWRKVLQFGVMTDLVLNSVREHLWVSFPVADGSHGTSMYRLQMINHNLIVDQVAKLPLAGPLKPISYVNEERHLLVLQEGGAIFTFNLHNNNRVNIFESTEKIAAIGYF